MPQEKQNPDWSDAFDQDGELSAARSSKKLNKFQLEYHEHIKKNFR